MTARKNKRASSRGRFVDDLLIASVVCLALVVCAYLYMPDFERGIQSIVKQVASKISSPLP